MNFWRAKILSTYISGSILTYLGLFGHIWVSFDRCRSLFPLFRYSCTLERHSKESLLTQKSLFWLKRDVYESVLTDVGLCFYICSSLLTSVDWKDTQKSLFWLKRDLHECFWTQRDSQESFLTDLGLCSSFCRSLLMYVGLFLTCCGPPQLSSFPRVNTQPTFIYRPLLTYACLFWHLVVSLWMYVGLFWRV